MTHPAAAQGWNQLSVTCDTWQSAERVAVDLLRPLLTQAQTTEEITGWWYIRKGNTWRVRMRSATSTFIEHLTAVLAKDDRVDSCATVIYEPETTAFGGPDGMAAAHQLFEADSRHLLDHVAATGGTYRRELPLLLAARLMRGAGLEWFEQGDCWARLAQQRSDQTQNGPDNELIAAVATLISATTNTANSPLLADPGWADAFEATGRRLAELAATGLLTRGLRAVITHHLIFLFNRHGIAKADQYRLATAARRVVFDTPDEPHHIPAARTIAANVAPVTDTNDARTTELRDALTDWIRSRGTFTTAAVEAAFRTVPRHLFLPGVPLETAYGRHPVVTQRGADGDSVSSASSPNLVATMLEQLGVHPGQNVLEIGAATGINAALLQELVTEAGTVVTIELDPVLAAGARDHLTAAGYPKVTVLAGDGALGHPAQAPYDRITVTAEAWDIPPAWWDQLAAGGRIVVPVRLHGSGLTRSIGFDLAEPGRLVSTSAVVCGFVPMRGATEHAEQIVTLSDAVALRVDTADQPDEGRLGAVLTQPQHTVWTGIEVRHDEPAEHLDLWLLTHTDTKFGRLSVTAQARADGVNPALRWGGATLYAQDTIAYLTTRELNDDTLELGVVAHGPGDAELTSTATTLLQRWAGERPAQPAITAHRTSDIGEPARTPAYLVRPTTTFTINW